MKEEIGKYWVEENKFYLKVNYRYSLSDIFGLIIPILGFIFGTLFLYLSFLNFSPDKILKSNFWFFFIIGTFLILWFSYIIILSFYNPRKGILEINKLNRIVIIRDFLKTETINFNDIGTVFCLITDTSKPRQKFGTLKIKKKNNEIVNCLLIRSAIPFDLGREVDLDILKTSNSIKNRIMIIINKNNI